MKKLISTITVFWLSSFAAGSFVHFEEISQQPLKVCSGNAEHNRAYFESKVLSEHHQVHINEGRKGFTLFPDYSFRTVNVFNLYTGSPGGYIACYSHEREGSAYQIPRTNIFIHGLIRTTGVYDRYTFRPFSEPTDDIGKYDSPASQLCRQHIKTCVDCWAGGDTGSFVGIKGTINPEKPCKVNDHPKE
ncbi:hypothetical protein [Parendozoicomonas sp. Alg238-R29]|uniref:hypothetical protein n=1 Tax=Parendozoicomonas sp. Alg238-R29 TaxID=2993446 RepID=UPI00248EC853|nr:hypothetical protein [Parendozoicomonas sp. Alg238-R29]